MESSMQAEPTIARLRPIEHQVPPGSPPDVGVSRRRGPAKKRWKRLLIAAAAISALGATAWQSGLLRARARPANVMTAVAAVGDVEDTVLASGTLKPVKLVAVGAQVSGRLTSLKVSVGQKVKAGDLVAEIDSLPQENTLRSAKAALANVRAQRDERAANLALAESTLARAQLTLARQASSRADFDVADTNVKTTRAQIAQLDAQIAGAEVAVKTAELNLGYTRITAPVDGSVLAVVTQEGQTVNSVQAAPTIVVLGQLDRMTIRAEISEADVVRIRPDQTVYFTILGDPDRRFTATLRSIEPAPESVKRDSSFADATSAASGSSTTSAVYYNAILEVPNTDEYLRTYMTAEVHIVLGQARNVVTVPASALGSVAKDGGSTVEVVDADGAVAVRNVTVGLDNRIAAEIRSGLRAGERVVTGSRLAGDPAPRRGGGPPP
jgi:membrane fusion protein, macrolide-specific efflux system